jgi:hypothetical protein
MRNIVRVRFECIEGVHLFRLKPEMAPLTPKETTLFAGVETAYHGLKDYLVDQGTGNRAYREGAAARRLLVYEMWAMSRRISDIARSIAEEGADPGMAEKFRLPRANRTYLTVAAIASGFADAAEPLLALFTERGMEATFVADLRAKVTAFETASATRARGLSVQTTGTAGLLLLAKQGLKFVRLLRPVITEKLKNNPALLASWKLVSRVASTASVAVPTGGEEQPPEGSGDGEASVIGVARGTDTTTECSPFSPLCSANPPANHPHTCDAKAAWRRRRRGPSRRRVEAALQP